MQRTLSTILAGLAALVIGAATAVAQSPTPAAPAGPAPLAEAVAFAPLGTSGTLFTDWAAMKAAHGYADVTSVTPIDERTDAMLDLGRTEAPFAGFAVEHFLRHAETWGWDTTDLDWEASFVIDGPPVAVLRFRDGFDLAGLAPLFDERGFSTSVHGDATIRSHDLEMGADWLQATDFGILNTAFLDDGRTLVLSADLEAVKAALDARHIDVVRAPPAWVVADRLGVPFSAAIEVGADACLAYHPSRLPGDDGANDALLAEVGPLRAWEAMGLATERDAADAAVGRFVFQYPGDADALADEGGRARLADEGISLRAGEPYATTVFRLTGFGADGASLDLDVAPVDGLSRRLQQAFFSRDLVFATCG